jgi:hypothetical protein
MNYAHHFWGAVRVVQYLLPGEFRNSGNGRYPPAGESIPQQHYRKMFEPFQESGADAIRNGEDSLPLGQRQREIVYVSRNMVDVSLMKWGLNDVEEPPRYATALKSASPNFCGGLRRQGPSNSLEHPFQAEVPAILLTLVMRDVNCAPPLTSQGSSRW